MTVRPSPMLYADEAGRYYLFRPEAIERRPHGPFGMMARIVRARPIRGGGDGGPDPEPDPDPDPDPDPGPGPDPDPDPDPAPAVVALELLPLPDAETAANYRHGFAEVGRLVAIDPIGGAVFGDAGDPSRRFSLGAPLPTRHYGDLVAAGDHRYVLELEGKRLVPDDATLAAKGYQPGEAAAISDDELHDLPTGAPYLTVAPPAPMVVRGDLRADTFLYRLDGGVARKQLLIGEQTLRYHGDGAVTATVAQGEIDAVPFADPPRLEELLAKAIVVTGVECVRHAHRGGGDTIEIRAWVDDLARDGAPASAAIYDHLIWQGDLDQGGRRAIGAGPLAFTQAIALAIHVNADTYVVDAGGPHVDTHGWLRALDGQIWFDTDLADQGERTVQLTAMTGGFLSQDWTVDYRLTYRVEYARDDAGRLIVLAPADYPSNAFRIKHFFVVMMENRSFDHLLGGNATLRERLSPAARLEPIDATQVDAPPGGFTAPFTPAPDDTGATSLGALDAGHEIEEVLAQLVGVERIAADGRGANGQILDGAGRLQIPLGDTLSPEACRDSFALRHGGNPDVRLDAVLGVMQPTIGQAYAINELAEEYTLCERWHASVPGPTWPNRFFVHCGTSGGLSQSPDNLGTSALVDFATGDGFALGAGSIFDRLSARGVPWRVYHADLPQVWMVKGMSPLWHFRSRAPLLAPVLSLVGDLLTDGVSAGEVVQLIVDAIGLYQLLFVPFGAWELAREIAWLLDQLAVLVSCGDVDVGGGRERSTNHFARDVADPRYLPFYTFIEPRQVWGAVNSGHPGNGPEARSEAFLESIYRPLRASPMWQRGECALVILYDEHGGLYDHVPPPYDERFDPGGGGTSYRTLGDPRWNETYHDGFDFKLLGLRVPAVVVSPYTARGRERPEPAVRGEVFNHASMLRTLQRRLGDTAFLTARVAHAANLFDTFGTTPLVAGDVDAGPSELRKYYVAPPPPPPPPEDDPAPIPDDGSPDPGFHLDLAAEILAHCGRDGTDRLAIAAAARAGTTSDARLASVQAAIAEAAARQRARRAGLTTRGEGTRYVAEAEAAIAGYRARLGAAHATHLRTWVTATPREKYARLRAAMNTAPDGGELS